MRGKVHNTEQIAQNARITPAYAGKSAHKDEIFSGYKDHPRLCGEKAVFIVCCQLDFGSPPPMRGKGSKGFWNPWTSRITPAYAGKSFSSYKDFAVLKDHPRLCGEKTKKIPKQRYFFHQPASFSFSLQYT